MENPRYYVNIAYVPNRLIGMTAVGINGVTQSIPYHGGGDFFQASMPEVRLYATGSTYADALDNLITLSELPSSYEAAQGPLGNIRTA